MKRHYDLDVYIENAKIGEGKKSVSIISFSMFQF